MSWLRSKVPAGKAPLLLNLDETSVAYSYHGAKGNHVRREPFAKIQRRELRGAVTHVAIISDRPDVQPVLHQVIIGNYHRFT